MSNKTDAQQLETLWDEIRKLETATEELRQKTQSLCVNSSNTQFEINQISRDIDTAGRILTTARERIAYAVRREGLTQ